MEDQFYSDTSVQLSLDIDYWKSNDILLMMDGVLSRSLEQLNDIRVQDEIAREVYEWVMSDEILPFSFAVCCRALGYDHEKLREAVLASIDRASFA